MDLDFRARLWRVGPESGGAWHFVTLPRADSAALRASLTGKPAFGAVAVAASIGRTRWKTSLFWDSKRQAYLLPVKAGVRRREQLRAGDTADVLLVAGLGR